MVPDFGHPLTIVNITSITPDALAVTIRESSPTDRQEPSALANLELVLTLGLLDPLIA